VIRTDLFLDEEGGITEKDKYSIIYCDPPWDYKGGKQHSGSEGVETGGAIKHYSTVKVKKLKDYPMESICEKDCLMFMWTSSPHLDQAINLMGSWGFDYKTIAFVWHKGKTNPGYYTMSQCEIVLVGKRKKGKIPQPRGARNIRQFLQEDRGKHSAKPSEIRDRINLMFPSQKKIELFSREEAEGWDCWGFGVEGKDKEYLDKLKKEQETT